MMTIAWNLILIHHFFQRKEDEELARKREEEKKARDYALLDQVDEEEQIPQYNSVQEMMDDFMWIIDKSFYVVQILYHLTSSVV